MPDIRISHPQVPSEPRVADAKQTAEAPRTEASAIRKFLLSRGNSAVADGIFHVLIVLCALSIFGIVILIATELVLRSDLAWNKFGLSFFFKAYFDPGTGLPSYWDPVNGHFSALPFVYGTLVSSLLSLLLAVPLAIGLAIFLTEMCPGALSRAPGLSHGVAGCHSEHHLRLVGGVHSGAFAPRTRESVAD